MKRKKVRRSCLKFLFLFLFWERMVVRWRRERKSTRWRKVRWCILVMRWTVVNAWVVIRYRLVQVRSEKTVKIEMFVRWEIFFPFASFCLLTALQRAQARPPAKSEAEEVLQRWSRAQPAQPPGSNTVVIFTKESLAKPSLSSFWKDNIRYRKKKERNKTTHRTKMPGRTLLSFAHPLCLGTLSFAEGQIDYLMDLKRSLFFSFASCLLTALQRAQARPPTEPEVGGGVAMLIVGSARPNPWHQYSCSFHQRVFVKLSLALEKARKSVLRKMSIRTFLSGDCKRH